MNTRRLLDFFSSKTFLYLTLGWFALQGIYFALTIRYGLPPDENYHFLYIKYFAENLPSPIPAHQQGYDILLDAVRNPFFIYHYLLAFPYKIVSDFSNAYIFIRLLNVLLGLGSLIMVVKVARVSKISPLARNLSMFMLVNTLMFTFIFSAISYDNLFIFLSLSSVLLLIKLYKKVEASLILLFLISLTAGLLTKINFLPVAFIIFILFAFKYYKKLGWLFNRFRKTFSDSMKLNVLLSIIFVFLGVLFIQRYIVNEVSYGSFNPACEKTRTIQQCRGSDLYVRNEMIYAPNHPTAKESLPTYIKAWVPMIENRSLGVFAHKEFKANKVVMAWSTAILLVGALLLLQSWKSLNEPIRLLVYISVFYIAVLFVENIHNYHASGRIGFAVHGRYLFNVLPFLYLISNYLILEKLKRPVIKLGYAGITAIIFLACGFPSFIQKTTPQWYKNENKPIASGGFSSSFWSG